VKAPFSCQTARFPQARRISAQFIDEALSRAAQPWIARATSSSPFPFRPQQHGGIGPATVATFPSQLARTAAPDDPRTQFGVDFLLEVELFLGESFGFRRASLVSRSAVTSMLAPSVRSLPRGIKAGSIVVSK